MKKKFLILALVLAILSLLTACGEEEIKYKSEPVLPSKAEMIADGSIEDKLILIETAEELMAIPNGSDRAYALANDIDMSGMEWTPIDFKGSFDGQGHSIIDLAVKGYSMGLELAYDGNMKEYKVRSCGLFGVLEDAEVKNLKLKNEKFMVDTEECIFAGSIAGFMKNSTIDEVSVSAIGSLKTTSKCFGIGGFAGYGYGEIKNSKAVTTLICIDQNVKEKDEQFLGGAYAAGRIDLIGNDIAIDAYDSDHGYVHNGGLVGMYIHYDEDVKGRIENNYVSGRIRFFEDNKDRRAYCEPFIGEVMTGNLSLKDNKSDFLRDEVFEYSTDLYPEEYEEH